LTDRRERVSDTIGVTVGGGRRAAHTATQSRDLRSESSVVGRRAMALALPPLSIDGFGLVVALPSIASDLKAGTADLAWVLNVTILFFGAATMVTGRLSDIIGRRSVVTAGVIMLGSTSIGCAGRRGGWALHRT
jgi:MFS family permease